jgi:hypothetical protein
MPDTARKLKLASKLKESKNTKPAEKMCKEDKKALACWVGKRLLESQEKIEKTLNEMRLICERAKK